MAWRVASPGSPRVPWGRLGGLSLWRGSGGMQSYAARSSWSCIRLFPSFLSQLLFPMPALRHTGRAEHPTGCTAKAERPRDAHVPVVQSCSSSRTEQAAQPALPVCPPAGPDKRTVPTVGAGQRASAAPSGWPGAALDQALNDAKHFGLIERRAANPVLVLLTAAGRALAAGMPK